MVDNARFEMDKLGAYTFLAQHQLGVISSVDVDTQPHNAAVYYVADEDLNIYFLTKTGTDKFHNLKAIPAAAFVVVDQGDQESVQIQGTCKEVEDGPTINRVMEKIKNIAHNNAHWPPPIAKLDAGEFVVMQVTPKRVITADYKQFKPSDNEDYIRVVKL